jgi:rRNA maturation endonuclease Nob1
MLKIFEKVFDILFGKSCKDLSIDTLEEKEEIQSEPELKNTCKNCKLLVKESDLVTCKKCGKEGCRYCMTQDVNSHDYYCDDCW